MHEVTARSTAPRGRTLGRTARARVAAALLAAGLGGGLGACTEVDGWLWDPSVVGRWENTPTVVPVLERIDVIEAGTGEFVEVTQVRPEDLVALPIDYTADSGDIIDITIYDFIQTGVPSLFQTAVDNSGYLAVPQLDLIYVKGMTAQQIQTAIVVAVIEAGILNEPEVSAVIVGQRQATYSAIGSIPRVNTYQIPYPDFRLLDALTLAGGVSPVIPNVYIIRKESLTSEAAGLQSPSEIGQPVDPQTPAEEGGANPLDLIDDVLDDSGAPPVEPGAFSSGGSRPARPRAAATNNGDLADLLDGDLSSPAVNPARLRQNDTPFIDLDDSGPRFMADGGATAPASEGRWVFRNGRWQRLTEDPPMPAGLPEGADPLEEAVPAAGELVTQRVIEVPVTPLLRGVAQYNVVVRPGDVINVPSPDVGVVYIGGPGINRPGTYTLNGTTRLTLQRAVLAAGGFSAIGIPERVDVTRMIGNDRQATIRLNARAIFEGTAPDIVLRPDDIVNFGTNWWATPFAIVRGGFRATYGFGFLLDRNFGNDVFGAPPSSQFNN